MMTVLLTAALALAAHSEPAAPPRPVPWKDVTITDGLLANRQKVNHDVTAAAVLDQCERTGRVQNLRLAGDALAGTSVAPESFRGYFFDDSDVYKAIEGASYLLTNRPDPALVSRVDDLIKIIARAQHPDGYINAYYTIKDPKGRWSNLADMHELYCAGHLIEAGVAHAQATGREDLLNVARKLADLIDRTFGAEPGKRRGVCGHPEIELALIRLWRHTGEDRYLKLAEYFINDRGQADRARTNEYHIDHTPIREHTRAVGHAVRAAYLYAGATDLAAIRGDAALARAVDAVWRDLTTRKMYVTGGIGNSSANEGFTTAFDLPNDSAYAETCAGIALFLWNHRLNQLHRDAKYADAMELNLYNSILSGVSASGDRFFYTNPLASRGGHQRVPWFACACCPPNILRLVGSLGGYVYTQTDTELWANIYAPSRARVKLGGTTVAVTQQNEYPWDGGLTFIVEPDAPAEFTLNLRIPGWAWMHTLYIDGKAVDVPVRRGYAAISRRWEKTTRVELMLEMTPERLVSDPRIKWNLGRVAVRRGPVVYAIEHADHARPVRPMILPDESTLVFEMGEPVDGLGRLGTIRAEGLSARAIDFGSGPYQASPDPEPVSLRLIPYFSWANRHAGEMVVWIPSTIPAAERPAPAGVKATASATWSADSPDAMIDGVEPESSSDGSIPRHTFWPRKGTSEWVQLDFERPRSVSTVGVYWFRDAQKGGGCDLPKSWRLLAKVKGEWAPVTIAASPLTEADRFNELRFDPIEAQALRVEVELRPDRSAGILEWRIED